MYPDKQSIQKLEKKVSDHVIWSREYLLKLIPNDDQVIHHSWLRFANHMPNKEDEQNKYRVTATGVDLAISEKETADYTAAVTASVFGHGEEMKIYIHPHPLNKRLNFPAQRQELMQLSEQLEHATFYIEDVGYQAALIQQLPQEGMYNVEGVKIGTVDKRSRLAMTSHYIKNGTVIFPRHGAEELISQLTGFGVEKHDDLADAFSLLILKLVEEYLAMSSGSPFPTRTRRLDDEKPFTAGFLDRVW
ncbi:MAG TPA: hypothetical protein VLG69_05090 [Candidatus Andersenbacteria bacterium]|nr:hypothetical protein [Candidatus Andersenbacteria bacterium]